MENGFHFEDAKESLLAVDNSAGIIQSISTPVESNNKNSDDEENEKSQLLK